MLKIITYIRSTFQSIKVVPEKSGAFETALSPVEVKKRLAEKCGQFQEPSKRSFFYWTLFENINENRTCKVDGNSFCMRDYIAEEGFKGVYYVKGVIEKDGEDTKIYFKTRIDNYAITRNVFLYFSIIFLLILNFLYWPSVFLSLTSEVARDALPLKMVIEQISSGILLLCIASLPYGFYYLTLFNCHKNAEKFFKSNIT